MDLKPGDRVTYTSLGVEYYSEVVAVYDNGVVLKELDIQWVGFDPPMLSYGPDPHNPQPLPDDQTWLGAAHIDAMLTKDEEV